MLKICPSCKTVFLQEAFTVSGLVHAAPVFTTVPPQNAARRPNIQRFAMQGAISYQLFSCHFFCGAGIMSNIPTFKFAFVFFMVTSSWTLLSILTAVASWTQLTC